MMCQIMETTKVVESWPRRRRKLVNPGPVLVYYQDKERYLNCAQWDLPLLLALQQSGRSTRQCAMVGLAVHVSLKSRLINAADDVCV